MKIFVISSNYYNNSCESDDAKDVVDFLGKELPNMPTGTVFTVSVRNIPKEIWDAQPKFEGFKRQEERTDGSD